MAWPFKKTQRTEQVPTEIQEYYQAEQREKTGVAWLLALATLAGTVLVVLALFFGGRWIYQKITNDKSQPVSVQDSSGTDSDETTNEAESDDEAIEGSGTTSNESAVVPSSPSASGPSGSTPGTSAPTPNSVQPRGGQSPVAGTIPQTGPSETAAIVLGTSLVATALHYFFGSRRKSVK